MLSNLLKLSKVTAMSTADLEALAREDLGAAARPELVKAWVDGHNDGLAANRLPRTRHTRVSVDLTPDLYDDLTNLAAELSRTHHRRISLAEAVRSLIRAACDTGTANTR